MSGFSESSARVKVRESSPVRIGSKVVDRMVNWYMAKAATTTIAGRGERNHREMGMLWDPFFKACVSGCSTFGSEKERVIPGRL